MKKSILSLICFFIAIKSLYSLDITAGTYYYDNSKTQYQTIQFLYGNDNPASYTIIDLVDVGNNKWKLSIPSTANGVYRYCFTHTSLPTGTFIDRGFSEMKDYISLTLGNQRTATKDTYIPNNGTFVPESSDNWAQGNWNVELSPTGTLPVFYLNTENSTEITSKDYYLNGTLYVDASNIEGYTSSGSAESPIATETKGRGNYTWREFEKKPYRIKMKKKNQLLNMTTDKSYNLLAHADDATFLRNTIGFELSRILGMSYTPTHEPVEFVMNGKYWGLYFLTDHIKVSSERVNITEQDDLETNPDLITGGWLMEIDNYEEETQVSTSRVPRFTYKSPEILSPEQDAYIRSFLQKTEDAIYVEDKNSTEWENYIDLNTLVDFYIIQEIMGNTESFNGSCYFTKDRGADTKIFFGPVWDFGNAFRHGHQFIYQDIMFSSHWLPEIVKYPRFQKQVSSRWSTIRYTTLPVIYDYIEQFTNKISQAVVRDNARWPIYGSSNYSNDVKMAKDYLTDRIEWLNEQWYDPSSIDKETTENSIHIYPNPTANSVYINSPEQISEVRLFDLSGKRVKTFSNVNEMIELNVDNGSYIIQVLTDSIIESRIILVKK